jgi:hypothetical protein
MMTGLPDIPTDADQRISALISDGRARLDQRHTRRRRAGIAITAAAAVALATSGYAVVNLATHQAQARSTWCYAGESSDTRSTQVGIPDSQTDQNGKTTTIADPADRVASAIDLCASVWKVGSFTTTAKTDRSGVPALVPCVRNDQVIAVYAREAGSTRTDEQICAANNQRLAG